jgi:hypothetical protein
LFSKKKEKTIFKKHKYRNQNKTNTHSHVQANQRRTLVRPPHHLASRASIAWRRPTGFDADRARAATSETDELAGQEPPALIDLVSPVFFFFRLLIVNYSHKFVIIIKILKEKNKMLEHLKSKKTAR